MIVQIADDFDPQKIEESGQCFRVRRMDDGWRFITQNHVLYLSEAGENGKYEVSCPENEWKAVWVPYFDLSRCYQEVRHLVPARDPLLSRAAEEGRGIRILRQDPWETLITFILSQRKNIPAIKDCVERLAERYGTLLTTPREEIYAFPSAGEMIRKGVTESQLRECKAGYRAGYILRAVSQAADGMLNLEEMNGLSDEDLFTRLTGLYGVGRKVADCVCLYAYGRTAMAPVDTWIRKVIDQYYSGENPFPAYGESAGILQQYVFYYAQKHKDEFRAD